uniref:Putative secreted protein n=1 Tax=Anopheles darlingi TaxID=43151 RepID=A0A2M4DAD4_ANODA
MHTAGAQHRKTFAVFCVFAFRARLQHFTTTARSRASISWHTLFTQLSRSGALWPTCYQRATATAPAVAWALCIS